VTVNPVAIANVMFLVSIPTSVLLGATLLGHGIQTLWRRDQ
jgi:hypothetical protein